jgi:cell division protease FtsH
MLQSKFHELPSFKYATGADHAKIELKEVSVFLKNQVQLARGQDSKGCLLVGRPRDRDDAARTCRRGEARVSFFSGAASEFVELFVYMGASR